MSNQYVLLTRTKEDSSELQTQLQEEGINSFICPILSIETIDNNDFSLADYLNNISGILITSKHSPPLLPSELKNANIPIFSIGPETTNALNNNGFSVTTTATSSSASLKECLDHFFEPTDIPQTQLLHFGGQHISEDFQSHIIDSEYSVKHIAVYEAVTSQTIPKEIENMLINGKIFLIMFYSARTASAFEELTKKKRLSDTLKDIQALCLAPSVVKSLDNTKWKKIIIADQPNSACMLEAIKNLVRSKEA